MKKKIEKEIEKIIEQEITREQAVRIALPYARISDKKQEDEGDGLNSQDFRLKKHCAERRYFIERIFREVKSAKGDYRDRPEMVKLLKYLEANKQKHIRYVVVFDDFWRFSRDAEYYWPLKRAIEKRGGELECPNFNFEDTPEGRHAQTTAVAGGQLHREQNARSTRQKMTARAEQGYYVYAAPIGYVYRKVRGKGHLLFKHDVFAPIVKEAYEGFASGRFQSHAEVARFLAAQPAWPRDSNGEVRIQRVVELFSRPVYAGYVEASRLGVSLRKGLHEPIISFETYQKVQDRLSGRAVAPARKNIHLDFPLRGAVECADCGLSLTSCHSTGRSARYGYYLCHKRGCPSYGKSIKKDVLEGAFEDLLKRLQPPPQYAAALCAMLEKVWNHRLAYRLEAEKGWKLELAAIKQQTRKLVDRMLEVDTPSVIAVIEERIRELEQKRLLLEEKQATVVKPAGDFNATLRTALQFLASPWNIWNSGPFEHKRMVLKLALDRKLVWARNEGLRTANLTLPFKVLEDWAGQNFCMVPKAGLEPARK